MASLLQVKTFNNVRLVKRLEQAQREDMVRDSARELLRPLIADGMINFDKDPLLRLNGTEFQTELDGYMLSIHAQDVDGLVDIYKTPETQVRALLPQGMAQSAIEVRASGHSSLPLDLLFTSNQANQSVPSDTFFWVTNQANSARLNAATLSKHYPAAHGLDTTMFDAKQPTNAVVGVEIGSRSSSISDAN